MDSIANWDSLDHARSRHTSPAWNASRAAGGFEMPATEQRYDFSALKVRGLCSTGHHTSELNGLQSPLMTVMATGVADCGPITSTEEGFGHWRPVYDEKSKPIFSLTGTEIWAAQKSESEQKDKTRSECNLSGVSSSTDFLREDEDCVEKVLSCEELGTGQWDGSSIPSGDCSEHSVGSRRLSITSSLDGNGGWGRTPVCQEKPWDLHHDGVVLETGAALAKSRHWGGLDLQDLGQDCPLNALKAARSPVEPLEVVGNRQGRPRSDLPNPDEIRLLHELQRLGSVDVLPPDELIHSRRGSSVSSMDGMPPTGLGGKKDPGYEPQANVQLWVDKQKSLPPLHRDDWNPGSGGRPFSSVQSPTGWGNMEKAPLVDDGTTIWGKQPEKQVIDNSLLWAKMLKATPAFPSSVPPFNFDVTVPPPPLNTHPMLPPGIVSPSPPVVNVASLLSNLQPSGNLVAKTLNSPLPHVASSSPGSFSSDILEKPWLLQQQQHLGQRPWMTGNQWTSSDTWNNMQRKGTFTMLSRVPQTRSRLIQQLVSMGFKKEDSQNALIKYNMDLEKALAELVTKHRSKMAPPPPSSSSFDASLHPLLGRLQQNVNSTNELPRNPAGFLPGHPLAMAGASKDASAARELTRLPPGTSGWEALLQTSTAPFQLAGSQPMKPLASPVSLPSLHSLHPLHGILPTAQVPQREALPVEKDELSQLHELAFGKTLPERTRGCSPADDELFRLFTKQLSITDTRSLPEGSGAMFALENSPLIGQGATDKLGLTQNSVYCKAFPGSDGSQQPAAESKKTDISAEKGLRFDGFGATPSLINRQMSLNVSRADADPPNGGMKKLSEMSGSLQSLSGVTKPGRSDLPSVLEVKEFFPGVLWKGTQATSQKPLENHMEEPATVPQEVVYDDSTNWMPSDSGDSVQKCLPSKWVQLKNVPEKQDDTALHDLCATHGPVKVFREGNGLVLLSYVELDDAIRAQEALNQQKLDDTLVTAEFVEDWTTSADGVEQASELMGYLTPNGLWIPPDADRAPVYFDGADEWCDEQYSETQPEQHWHDDAEFDPETTAYLELDSQK